MSSSIDASTTRPFILAGNWKMHKGPRETKEFFEAFVSKSGLVSTASSASVGQIQPGSRPLHLTFFVPALVLGTAHQVLSAYQLTGTASKKQSSIPLHLGLQNVFRERQGAWTGENSAVVAAEMGANSVLVGHSERRTHFAESDQLCAQKLMLLRELNLQGMLCIGETLEERDQGKTEKVLARQLDEGFKSVLPAALSLVTSSSAANESTAAKFWAVAYEPVWAIGTGRVAQPEQVESAHKFIRQHLSQESLFGPEIAGQIPLLYGGSVKPDNAGRIGRLPEVDGFLVGGASLEVESFLALYKEAVGICQKA